LVFRGYLRELIFSAGLFGFLCSRRVRLTDFGKYAESLTERLKTASLAEAARLGRPVQHLWSSRTDKEETARQIATRDGITKGLVCVLTSVEPCRSFDVGHDPKTNRFGLRSRFRKCLFLYHYMIDPVFGWLNARIQTWLPFDIQICMNGREWLSRQMDDAKLWYLRRENCFPWIESVPRAQKLMDEQLRTYWPGELSRIARQLNPDHVRMLGTVRLPYYWGVHQSEWATDLMFNDAASLAEIYPRLTRHAISAFSSADVIRFLGGKVHGAFQGEIVSDFKDRPEGVRIKHRVGTNSVKMYDKQGSVLRIETTLNDAAGIKVFRPKEGDGRGKRAWRPMRKGIADLHRRAQVSQASNDRYLDAMAAADTTTPVGTVLKSLDRPVTFKGARVRGIRASSAEDVALIKAVNRGEFCLNGLRNADLRSILFGRPPKSKSERARRTAKVTRLIRLLRAHKLIRKVSKSRRYKLTTKGRQILTVVLAVQDVSIAKLNDAA
jgi:hypothetical protein